MDTVELGSGLNPTVTYYGPRGYLAGQFIGLRPSLDVYSWSHDLGDLAKVATYSRPLPMHDAGFPTIHGSDLLWLAYRVDGFGKLECLNAPTMGVKELGPVGGVSPFAFRDHTLAYRGTGDQTHFLDLTTGNLTRTEIRKTSQGLSGLTDDGKAIYRDDVRGVYQPRGNEPQTSGPLIVVQAPTGGARVWFTDLPGRSLLLWPGRDCKIPDCVWDGTRAAVTVGGPIRVATFTRDDLEADSAEVQVPSIGHPCWVHYLQQWGNAPEDAGPDYPAWPELPGNSCAVETLTELVRSRLRLPSFLGRQFLEKPLTTQILRLASGRIVGWLLHGSLKDVAVQAARARQVAPAWPTFGILDFPAQPTGLKIPHLDCPIYELYPLPNETPAVCEARLGAVITQAQYRQVGLVIPAYTMQGRLTVSQIVDLTIAGARLAQRPKVKVVELFAANRSNGMRNAEVCAALLPLHQQLLAGVPAAPGLQRVA